MLSGTVRALARNYAYVQGDLGWNVTILFGNSIYVIVRGAKVHMNMFLILDACRDNSCSNLQT